MPQKIKEKSQPTYRSITVDGNEIEFSGGFTDLRTESYKQILLNKGFGIKDARQSIEIVHEIKITEPVGLKGDYHHFIKNK